MEQIVAVFGLDVRLLLIQGVNFLVLLGVLSYFLYRPILAMLEKRERAIAEGVRAAEAAKLDRNAAEEEKKSTIAKAIGDADGIVRDAKVAAQHERDVIVKEARVEEKRIKDDAEARAKETLRRAEESAREEIARASVLMAESLLRKQLD
jgi:F-type H+-transporting ATPase subunit b